MISIFRKPILAGVALGGKELCNREAPEMGKLPSSVALKLSPFREEK